MGRRDDRRARPQAEGDSLINAASHNDLVDRAVKLAENTARTDKKLQTVEWRGCVSLKLPMELPMRIK